MNTIESRIEYGKALDSMGFNYHNIIRYKRYQHNQVSSEKISTKQLDWYMKNLLKRKEVSMAWACIEPDIDPYTKKHLGSTHVHFAYNSILDLSLLQLSKFMRINRVFLRESRPLDFSMGYFTKHTGKNLLYHNLYA